MNHTLEDQKYLSVLTSSKKKNNIAKIRTNSHDPRCGWWVTWYCQQMQRWRFNRCWHLDWRAKESRAGASSSTTRTPQSQDEMGESMVSSSHGRIMCFAHFNNNYQEQWTWLITKICRPLRKGRIPKWQENPKGWLQGRSHTPGFALPSDLVGCHRTT